MPTVFPETAKVAAAIKFAQAINADNTRREVLDEVIADAQFNRVTLSDVLRSHLLLRATDGNAAIVAIWLSMPYGSMDNSGPPHHQPNGRRKTNEKD